MWYFESCLSIVPLDCSKPKTKTGQPICSHKPKPWLIKEIVGEADFGFIRCKPCFVISIRNHGSARRETKNYVLPGSQSEDIVVNKSAYLYLKV